MLDTLVLAKPLRIEYAGALNHVTSRGDSRETIILDAEDRVMWLDESGWRIERSQQIATSSFGKDFGLELKKIG